MSIGPGAESVGIELYTAATVTNRWQRAIWDGDHWASPTWQAIECEVLAAEYRTGAGTEAGVLSVADAGALDVHTYDPGRLLDPMAAGSPYFGAVKPGTPLRLTGKVPGAMPAWTGYLDEGRYELASAQGRLRALDGIAYLAQTEVPEGTVLPNTLRARVRAVVAAAGLTALVPVVPDSVTVQWLTNPSFESGVTGWAPDAPGAGSGTVPDAGAPDGANVLRLAGGGTAARYVQSIPVSAGQVLALNAWMFDASAINYVLNGWFAAGMANWPTYSGPAGSAGSGDPTVGTYGRWQGNGTGSEVQAIQSIPAVPGVTYTFSAWLYGTGVANHPTVMQVDARGTGSTLFNVVDLRRSTGGYALMTATYTVPAGVGINNFTIRIGIGQTDGSVATSASIAYISGITCTAPSLGVPRISLYGRDVNGAAVGGGASAYSSMADAWEGINLAYTVPADGSVLRAEVELALTGTSTGQDVVYFDNVRLSSADPASNLGTDPPVAPHDGKARAAWAIIQDAALDALTYVWLGPDGVLRFTAWGGLPDAKYAMGCPPAGEVGGVWLNGLAELEAVSQGEAIRNSVRSYVSGTTFGTALTDPNSIRAFGERRLDVPRIVPDAANWAQHILDDRSDAGLEVTLGEVRPYTAVELALLLEGAADGPSALRVADDSHGEPVDLTVAVIGAAVGVTANGWRFGLTTMIPRAEWDTEEPPPITPPTPPANPYHTETRTYIGTSDALLALTSGGAKYGAGAATTLPVGAWAGWTYRALIQFPNIPGTKLRRLISATLNLDTTDQSRVGFGSSPTIELKRITGAWSAGSSSSPSSGNAVVWPGPACTGSIRANVTASQNAALGIRVDALVLPWLPSAAGGSAAAQRGLALYPGSGSGVDTTEFWPVEKGGTQRPELVLVLEVFD